MWNVPEWGSPEASYLDLVSDVLGSGKNSRFYKRLVYEDQIATDAAGYISLNEIGGQFWVVGTALPGKDLAEVEAALDEELQRFLDEGPTEEEVQRVKTQHVARFVRGVERIGGFGGKSDILARNQIYAGRPDHYKTTLKRVQDATAEDLRESARRWLSDGVYALEVHPYATYTNKEDGADRTKLPDVKQPPELVWPRPEEDHPFQRAESHLGRAPRDPGCRVRIADGRRFRLRPIRGPGSRQPGYVDAGRRY